MPIVKPQFRLISTDHHCPRFWNMIRIPIEGIMTTAQRLPTMARKPIDLLKLVRVGINLLIGIIKGTMIHKFGVSSAVHMSASKHVEPPPLVG